MMMMIMIIVMKSSFNRDNNYCHYVIQRIAGFAITLYYHPAGMIMIMMNWLTTQKSNGMAGSIIYYDGHWWLAGWCSQRHAAVVVATRW
jgi:hypothetical protein